MGYVEDFLNMALEEMKGKKQKVTVDDLAEKLQEHLNLRNVKSRQLQCNSAELQPPTPTAKRISGLKKLSQVQQFLEKDTPMDYRLFYMNNVTVEVTITEPITPLRSSEREDILSPLYESERLLRSAERAISRAERATR